MKGVGERKGNCGSCGNRKLSEEKMRPESRSLSKEKVRQKSRNRNEEKVKCGSRELGKERALYGIRILYEDKELLVCYKPEGLPVQSAKISQRDMVSVLNNYLAEQGQKGSSVYVVHRLDQPVEGVMVFAKTKRAAAGLTRQIAEGSVQKVYHAVCCAKRHGFVEDKESHKLTDYLVKDGRTNTSRVVCRGESGAKEARLRYRILGWKELEKVREELTGCRLGQDLMTDAETCRMKTTGTMYERAADTVSKKTDGTVSEQTMLKTEAEAVSGQANRAAYERAAADGTGQEVRAVPKRITSDVSEKSGGIAMEPLMRLLLVEVHLDTGRHHQIRVQMAHAGLPLWGDGKYAAECEQLWQSSAVLERQALTGDVKTFGQDFYRNTQIPGQDFYRNTQTSGQDAYRNTQTSGQDSYRGMRTFGQDFRRNMQAHREELALCAVSLDFAHPVTGRKLHFEVKPQKKIFAIVAPQP